MSAMLTVRGTFVVLLIAVLAVVGISALAAGAEAGSASGTGAGNGPHDGQAKDQTDEPQIGTAIKMVRNADGSVTTYER